MQNELIYFLSGVLSTNALVFHTILSADLQYPPTDLLEVISGYLITVRYKVSTNTQPLKKGSIPQFFYARPLKV